MKTVSNILKILRCLSAESPELAVTEVSKRTNLPKSTVSRILNTLCEGGLMERDPVSRRFRCGLLAFELGALYQAQSSVLDVVQVALRELVEETGYMGYLAVLRGGDTVILRNHQGRHPVRFVVEPGRRQPAYASAVGKALLARRADTDIRALYPDPFIRPTSLTVRTVDELLGQMALDRQRLWSEACEETFAGFGAFGAAFQARDGGQAVAFSISYPINSVSATTRGALLDALLATARRAGGKIGDPWWLENVPEARLANRRQA